MTDEFDFAVRPEVEIAPMNRTNGEQCQSTFLPSVEAQQGFRLGAGQETYLDDLRRGCGTLSCAKLKRPASRPEAAPFEPAPALYRERGFVDGEAFADDQPIAFTNSCTSRFRPEQAC